MINRTCVTRSQARAAFEHGDTLRRTFAGTSGSVAHETTFCVDLRACGMVYDELGNVRITVAVVIFDGHYKARITPEQAYAYIERNYAPESDK